MIMKPRCAKSPSWVKRLNIFDSPSWCNHPRQGKLFSFATCKGHGRKATVWILAAWAGAMWKEYPEGLSFHALDHLHFAGSVIASAFLSLSTRYLQGRRTSSYCFWNSHGKQVGIGPGMLFFFFFEISAIEAPIYSLAQFCCISRLTCACIGKKQIE